MTSIVMEMCVYVCFPLPFLFFFVSGMAEKGGLRKCSGLLATATEGEDQMQRVAALEVVVGGRLVVGPARLQRQYRKR